MNDMVQRRTKFVFDNGYTSMKVNSRNATVVLPNAPAKVLENPKVGRKPSAISVIMLGQSMEIVIHKISDPKNTPSTPSASCDSPHMPGISLDPMITASARIRNAVSFTFLFAIILPLFFLSTGVSLYPSSYH